MFAALRQLGGSSDTLSGWQRTVNAPNDPPLNVATYILLDPRVVAGDPALGLVATYLGQPSWIYGDTPGSKRKLHAANSLEGLSWPGPYSESEVECYCAKAAWARWQGRSYVDPGALAYNPNATNGISYVLTMASGGPGVSDNNMGTTSACVADFCFVSADGKSFVRRPFPDGNWHICKYINGFYVALDFVWYYNYVGSVQGASNRLAFSPDGENWTVVTLPLGAPFPSPAQINRDILYVDGVYYIVGDGSYLLTSTNLTAWTRTTLPYAGGYSYGGAIANKGSTLCITGVNVNSVATSTSGVGGFVGYTAPTAGTGQKGIAVSNGYFVTTAATSTNSAASLDGKFWQDVPNPTNIPFSNVPQRNLIPHASRLLAFGVGPYVDLEL